jgi:hypothetical protein
LRELRLLDPVLNSKTLDSVLIVVYLRGKRSSANQIILSRRRIQW